jgi:hypothetical protein
VLYTGRRPIEVKTDIKKETICCAHLNARHVVEEGNSDELNYLEILLYYLLMAYLILK